MPPMIRFGPLWPVNESGPFPPLSRSTFVLEGVQLCVCVLLPETRTRVGNSSRQHGTFVSKYMTQKTRRPL